MFVAKQRGDDHDACPSGPRKRKAVSEPREQRNDADMHDARNEQGVGDAEPLGNGIEAGSAVVIDVLTGVQHVKAADPESDSCAKDQHARVETIGDGDPRSGRRNAESEAKEYVRPVREAFGERVEKEYGDGERSELQSE